jgi:anti-anti-sigma regulatory factor
MECKPAVNKPHLYRNRVFSHSVKNPEEGRNRSIMSCALVVKVPEALDAKNARKLGRELKSKFSSDSPFVVLDFSRVKDIDLPGLDGLLSCMNEVARQDGGLQLSGVSPEAATLLELMRVNELMQKFPGFSIDAQQFEVAPEMAPEEVPAESPVQMPVAA